MPFIANQGDFLNQYGSNIGNAYWQGAGNYDPTYADDGSGISGFNYGAASQPTYSANSTSQDWQNLFMKGGSWGGQDWAKLGDQFAGYDAANGTNLLDSFGEYQRQYLDPNSYQVYNPNFANRSVYDQSNVYGQLAGWLDQSGLGSQLGVNTGDLWNQASNLGTANAEDHRINDQSGGIFGKQGIPLPVLIMGALVGGLGVAGGLAAGAGTAAGVGAGEAAAGTGVGSAIDMGGSGLTMADWGLGGSGATGFGTGTVGGGGVGAFGTNLGVAGTGLGAFGGGEAIAGPGLADAGTTAASTAANSPTSLSDLIKQVQSGTGNLPPGTTTAIQKLIGLATGGGGTGTGGTGTGTGGNGTSGGNNVVGDITNLINSVLGYNQSNSNSDFLKNLLKEGVDKADPFASNRKESGDLLMQSYRDPLSVFNSSGYQALDKRLQDTMLARDAASGNLFNAPERLAQREAGFMDYLPKYQQNLMGMSGASGNPAAPAAFMASMAKPISDAGAKSNAILGSGVSSAGNILNSILTGGGNSTSGGTGGSILDLITKAFGGGSSGSSVIPTNVSGAANGSTFEDAFTGGFWNSTPAAATSGGDWFNSIPWDL